MIPPTSIDGTDITGATIDGTDVTEITVDGDTVFTAGARAPADAIHHWPFNEGSGSTVNNILSTEDITLNNPNWTSGTFEGGTANEFNGTNDEGDATVDISSLSEFTIFMTVEPNTTKDSVAINWDETGNSGRLNLRYDLGGNSKFRLRVGDGSAVNTAISTTTINTGEKYRLAATVQENNEIGIGVDGTIEATDSFGTLGPISSDMFVGYADFGFHFDGIIDNIIITDSVDTTQITNDFNNQPWS